MNNNILFYEGNIDYWWLSSKGQFSALYFYTMLRILCC